MRPVGGINCVGALLLCLCGGSPIVRAQTATDEHASAKAKSTPTADEETYQVRCRSAITPDEKAVDAVKQLALPGADDWRTEVQADDAKHALEAVVAVLKANRKPSAKDLAPFFVDNCQLPSLRPEKHQETDVSGLRAIRFDCKDLKPSLAPDAALRELFSPHGDADDLRVFLKVVNVTPKDDERFSTGLYVELSSSKGGKDRVQQNAEWDVAWKKARDGHSLQIAGITPVKMNEGYAQAKQFTDRTRSVIRDDEVWSPQLEHGTDWWSGRIDYLGGISVIGSEGIAVGDVNGDGLDDLYVCMAGGLPNKLLIQQADGSVVDKALEANVAWLDDCRGVLLVDMDNDGDQDLVLAMEATIGFLENDGHGVFTPRRRYIMPPGNLGPFYSLTAADFDNDGDLDIYCCRYQKAGYGVYPPEPYYDANNGPSNHLLRNDGKAGIKDVTNEVGLDTNNRRFSVVATWFDYDEDGDEDLYVANDFGRNNLYRNDHGKFVDVAGDAGVEDQASGMGISWSDYDLDGRFDVLISNMFSSAGRRVTYQPRSMADAPESERQALQRLALGNTLLKGRGDGTYVDQSEHAGIVMGRWAWGGMFVDINNDGYDDMVIPNGFITGPSKDDL